MPAPSPSSEPPVAGREPEATLRCPDCGRQAAPGDRFCEVDGAPLTTAPPSQRPELVCACGVGQGVDAGDGYCERCGMLLKPVGAADPTDGCEVLAPAPDLAAVTHRGRAHRVDEDAVAVARREAEGAALHLLVLCDGVSGSTHGELASAQAAQAGLGALLERVEGAGPLDPESALRGAIGAAHRAACAMGVNPPAVDRIAVDGAADQEPPGTTLIAAIACGGRVDVAWVGDSRAYLLGPPGPGDGPATAALLTHDHSWMNQVVESGTMTTAEAARSPLAHALTRCLGPLEDPDPERPPQPSLANVTAAPGSRLILCSDGVWNSAPAPADLEALVAGLPPAADAGSLALNLVRRALAMDGRDDMSAAVALL